MQPSAHMWVSSKQNHSRGQGVMCLNCKALLVMTWCLLAKGRADKCQGLKAESAQKGRLLGLASTEQRGQLQRL